MPSDSTFNQHIMVLWDDVAQLTRGALAVSVVPWGATGNSGTMLEKALRGDVHFYPVSGMPLASVCPQVAFEGIPYAFDSDEHAIEVFSGVLGERVRASVSEIGLHVIPGLWPQGHNQIPAVRASPFETAAQMRGFRIRTANSPFLVDLYVALGMDPRRVHLQGVRAALEEGAVQGVEMPPHGIEQLGIAGLHHSMTVLDIRWATFWMTAHGPTWHALDPRLRDVVTDACMRHANAYAADIRRENQCALRSFERVGVVGALEHAAVQDVLSRAGFYQRWRERLGVDRWALLESEIGRRLR
ncbi:hypothetical protein BAY60_19445 [Prauserella muralis]|uniref:TRAP-type C4-dicarboxylate transport system substrate-binding protein n=2 Tax=Prauserella muralis TaxID=588067 RepID=A0A2V4AVK6_9PSEU|nr:hypothetical protein BAY60_19445 [Prauserella muralis]